MMRMKQLRMHNFVIRNYYFHVPNIFLANAIQYKRFVNTEREFIQIK